MHRRWLASSSLAAGRRRARRVANEQRYLMDKKRDETKKQQVQLETRSVLKAKGKKMDRRGEVVRLKMTTARLSSDVSGTLHVPAVSVVRGSLILNRWSLIVSFVSRYLPITLAGGWWRGFSTSFKHQEPRLSWSLNCFICLFSRGTFFYFSNSLSLHRVFEWTLELSGCGVFN